VTKPIELHDTAEQPTNSPLGALNRYFIKNFSIGKPYRCSDDVALEFSGAWPA
jgi:hypothetical protein